MCTHVLCVLVYRVMLYVMIMFTIIIITHIMIIMIIKYYYVLYVLVHPCEACSAGMRRPLPRAQRESVSDITNARKRI